MGRTRLVVFGLRLVSVRDPAPEPRGTRRSRRHLARLFLHDPVRSTRDPVQPRAGDGVGQAPRIVGFLKRIPVAPQNQRGQVERFQFARDRHGVFRVEPAEIAEQRGFARLIRPGLQHDLDDLVAQPGLGRDPLRQKIAQHPLEVLDRHAGLCIWLLQGLELGDRPTVETDCVGQDQPVDPFRMPHRHDLRHAAADVMRRQIDPAKTERIHQPDQDPRLRGNRDIRARGLVRCAVVKHVGRDHPVALRQFGDHVAPQKAGGGDAVQQDQRWPIARVQIGDAVTLDHRESVGQIVCGHPFLLAVRCGRARRVTMRLRHPSASQS